jgi:hypothetical protein
VGGADAGAALLATAELLPWLTAHALAAASAWSRLADDFPLQPRRWHATGELSLAAHWGAFAVVVEDRALSPAFEGGWTAAGAPDDVISGGAFATLRWHNQITVAARRGPLTVWFSEDFTPGDPGGTGERWFYDSNAPDVVLGVAFRTAL